MDTRKILILGSGLVAQPCVDYLLKNPHNHLTIASRTVSRAAKLAENRARVGVAEFNVSVESCEELRRLVFEHDVVISLLPAMFHPLVVQLGINKGTHVVTTSYVSPAMRELEQAAKFAGITVMNEVGLDPGIDHCYAVKTIEEVHAKGGKIKEFYSYCGGLPAPEAATNPLKMKFSWSPRGVLASQTNTATFLKDGRVETVAGGDLMASAQPCEVLDGYSFLGYPNRDSVPFRELYAIPEAQTVLRGSLRYGGNPELVQALSRIGWLDTEAKGWLGQHGVTWLQATGRLVGATSGAGEEEVVRRVVEVCGLDGGDDTSEQRHEAVLGGLRWMGLFSSHAVGEVEKGRVAKKRSPLDTLSARLAETCAYEEGERDLVVLQHRFVVEWQDGTNDTLTATLEMFGDPNGPSAMAKCVGITCGIATELLLDGHPAVAKEGLVAPYNLEMCNAIRERVEKEGIKLVERVL